MKQTVPTDVTILKPEEGEMGLEITGKEIRKEQTRTPSSQSPVTLPGIISTIGGLSSSTTAIPVTEIPIHIPEVQVFVLYLNLKDKQFSLLRKMRGMEPVGRQYSSSRLH